MKAKLFTGVALLSLLAVTMGACATQPGPTPTPTPSPSPSPAPAQNGGITVYVTDAPPRDEVTSIMVTMSEVQVHRATAEQEREQEQTGTGNQTQEQEREQQQSGTDNDTKGEGKWLTISLSENATTFDLLKVRGIEQFLGTSQVEAGKYTQVRLVVDAIKVKLGDGELQDAALPGKDKELKIVRPFDIVAGETTALVIDFDADKMVTVSGNGKITVKPVIKNLTIRQEKSKGQQEQEKGKPQPTTEQPLVTVSYDEFMNARNVSQNVTVDNGDSFKVALASNKTTGFSWSETANITDTTILEQEEHEFLAPGQTGMVGAAGQEIWTFKALKTGTTTVSMEYSQPWAGGTKGEWTFQLTVTVK